MSTDPVLVKVQQSETGHEGPGFYVWEVDAEDEGYVLFSKTRPTVEELKAICPKYTEEEVQ
jgi:hypothetical protein